MVTDKRIYPIVGDLSGKRVLVLCSVGGTILSDFLSRMGVQVDVIRSLGEEYDERDMIHNKNVRGRGLSVAWRENYDAYVVMGSKEDFELAFRILPYGVKVVCGWIDRDECSPRSALMSVGVDNHDYIIDSCTESFDEYLKFAVVSLVGYYLKDVMVDSSRKLDVASTSGKVLSNDLFKGHPFEGDRKRILFIGCGTASLMMPILQKSPFVLGLSLVDGKKVERHNLLRQWFWEGQLGYHKVNALKKSLSLPVQSFPVFMEDERALVGFLDQRSVDCVVLSTGETTSLNHSLSKVLWDRRIPHIIPSILPAGKYYKTVIIDRDFNDNCYSCYQGEPVGGPPTISQEEREVFYGGTQPATPFETFPSAVFVVEALSWIARSNKEGHPLTNAMREGKGCFLSGNVVEIGEDGEPLYDLPRLGAVRALGPHDLNEWAACSVCGNTHGLPCLKEHLCLWCGKKEAGMSGYCSVSHKMMAEAAARKMKEGSKGEPLF